MSAPAPVSAPGYRWSGRRLLLFAAACGAGSLVLQLLVAAAGPSAAQPPLGPSGVLPPWDAGHGFAPAPTTALLGAAVALGAVAVALGLAGLRRGAALPRRLLLVGGLVLVCCVLVPPIGSADHLSYAAYGRIAATGGNPYLVDPLTWAGGHDPVTSAVQPPWQHTPSVYGPVATALQAAAAWAGAGSLRTTVWVWQLFCAAAFALTSLVLRRVAADPDRGHVLWTLNPLLIGQLVLGAHVDVLAVAAGALALALASRRPGLAGAAAALALGIKLPYGLVALALVVAVPALPPAARRPAVVRAVLGGLLVLVPAHLWSGVHTYDQLRRASRAVSLATPWRLLADQLDPLIGGASRTLVGYLALALFGLAAVLGLRFLARRGLLGADLTQRAAAVLLALSLAWLLSVPYALPWYEAMVWLPLALLGPARLPWLDGALLARLAVLALAYVPGRVVGLTPSVQQLTLGLRHRVAPWLLLALLLAVLAGFSAGADARASRRPAGRDEAAAGPGRPPAGPAR